MARKTRTHRRTQKHRRSRKQHRRQQKAGTGDRATNYAYLYPTSDSDGDSGVDRYNIKPELLDMTLENRPFKLKEGGARDEDPSCTKPGMPNNRNNLPYFPYVARGSLNSGFQYGDILMKEGFMSSSPQDNPYLAGGQRKHRVKKSMRKSKRGGGCGGQSRESWFRGAYPVVMV
jgi:hypothetical protein